MNEMMSDRLRKARMQAGYETAADAVRALGWEISAYRHHENGTREFGVEQAKRYASGFDVDPAWLLSLDQNSSATIPDSQGRIVSVTGTVAAGVWQKSNEWPQSKHYEIVVGPSPFPSAKRFGLSVDDHSADQIFPPRTVLDCVSIFDIDVAPESGDLVIVERVRTDGLREQTVKQYQRDDDGRTWLLPRSTKPEFQAPIEVGTPNADHDGDDLVQVIAYVIGSYQPHASRLVELARQNGLD